MISSLEASINDCCYFLLKNERLPRFGTIVKLIKNESAVQVIDSADGAYYVVWEQNAAWSEKELKGQKWEKPHNYIREISEETKNEEEPVKRVSNVRNRKKKTVKRKRSKTKS